jgi:hypothetical protein
MLDEKIALVVSINTIAGKDNIEPNRFAEMDFSSAYNDGFYNASNHPNYNAFATLQTNGSIF